MKVTEKYFKVFSYFLVWGFTKEKQLNHMKDSELKEQNFQRFNRISIKDQFSEVQEFLSAIHSDTEFQNLSQDQVLGLGTNHKGN